MKHQNLINTGSSLSEEDLKELIHQISVDLAAEVLEHFASTPSPSQLASWFRGPMVEQLLTQWQLANITWESNFKSTGNGILTIGNRTDAPVWIIAHWDNISFLVDSETKNGYKLTPFHHHLMTKEGAQTGHVIRYDVAEKQYKIICDGTIVGGDEPEFHPDKSITLKPGDRIAYNTPVKNEGDNIFSGQMDNAPGCAAALLAGAMLSKIDGASARICFVDEEEGPVTTGNTAFARGSRRLLHHLPAPELAIVVDHHTVATGRENPHMGKGALIKEYASRARGGVTPPWLYETVLNLSRKFKPDILLNENVHAEVSRSDCVSLMEVTPNIVLCGPPTVGRHYVNGTYLCSAHDVMHLSRSLFLTAQKFQ